MHHPRLHRCSLKVIQNDPAGGMVPFAYFFSQPCFPKCSGGGDIFLLAFPTGTILLDQRFGPRIHVTDPFPHTGVRAKKSLQADNTRRDGRLVDEGLLAERARPEAVSGKIEGLV